ncbi:hypothetical protein [Pseudobacillus wudalianchiensis]|uniref:Uncharacterized protein n=1 Tax=Pseudobacillus wudalianchiensis TaxID=1743143 RepID=A0A1B9AYB4_9BACI|nr:hypothetical protein [Bacillus wudalianchiensis]OCA88814.1 hypothetical protein A8F95_05075 [Bacillus wudalianchiensis]
MDWSSRREVAFQTSTERAKSAYVLAPAAGQKKSGADCTAPTSIRRNGEVAFFSHTARSAYDLEGQGGAARQEKSGGRSFRVIGGWRNFYRSRSLTPIEISKPPYALAPAARQRKAEAAVQRRMGWTAPHEIKETRRAAAIRC